MVGTLGDCMLYMGYISRMIAMTHENCEARGQVITRILPLMSLYNIIPRTADRNAAWGHEHAGN